MKDLDILAEWLATTPLDTPAPYVLIQDQAAKVLGHRPSNRFLPVALRDAGYVRYVNKFSTWYLRPGDTMPSAHEQGRRYFNYQP